MTGLSMRNAKNHCHFFDNVTAC